MRIHFPVFHARNGLKQIAYSVMALCLSSQALGQWTIDSNSSQVYFTTYKNIDIAESHVFKTINGNISEGGAALINIELNSVDTNIPIRDKRMKEMLFKTSTYPKALIKAKLDQKWISKVKMGEPQTIELNASLSLNGSEKPISMTLLATKLQNGQVQVTSLKPVIINAETWGLDAGVTELKKVAGLSSISLSVPVGFTLHFVEQ